jgi:hypothetical protein
VFFSPSPHKSIAIPSFEKLYLYFCAAHPRHVPQQETEVSLLTGEDGGSAASTLVGVIVVILGSPFYIYQHIYKYQLTEDQATLINGFITTYNDDIFKVYLFVDLCPFHEKKNSKCCIEKNY